MGSSKKHKERDRDREHKRKRRHRSRSRSREHDKKGIDKKHRKHSHREHGERESKRRKREYQDDDIREHSEHVQIRSKEEYDKTSKGAAGTEGEKLSMSIAEANKLRAKLGLNPLDVGGSKGSDAASTKKEDVHVPAVNLAALKKTSDLRIKMAEIKEKRLLNMKLGKVKTLAGSDSDEEDTAAWVRKNRKIQREREMAEKRAKLLEEMDQEFGVGGLVEAAFGQDKKKKYTSKDLKGLNIEHSADAFKEGKTIILTLQDKGILDEDNDDTLVNVNIVDDEISAKNLESRKLKPLYNPYDEGDTDEYGMMKQKELLSKYDDEIYGAKKNFFELGSGGKYAGDHERYMEEMRSALHQQGQSLQLDLPNLATEYFTTEEMETKFKKVKKKVRKIRKKATVADDLLQFGIEDTEMDHGSRTRGRGQVRKQIAEEEDNYLYGDAPLPAETEPVDMDLDQPEIQSSEILGTEIDLTGVSIEDEAGTELELALNKARKIKLKKPSATEKIAENIVANRDELQSDEDTKGLNIVLNSTSEFCRALGEMPTYGMAGNREDDEDEIADFDENELLEKKQDGEDEDQITGWTQVDIDTRPVDLLGEDTRVLDEEPLVDTGIGAALSLAHKKGYLEEEESKNMGATRHTEMQAQHYSIEDKRYDDLDDKYKRRERYSGGITTDFKEKNDYKPIVRLDYVDDLGRMLSPKEAFRQLSHRFHGKGSGKKKTEKRSKKMEEIQLMKMMSSTDTPLNTVSLLKAKQKAEKSPFIILSGGNKTITANSIVKPN